MLVVNENARTASKCITNERRAFRALPNLQYLQYILYTMKDFTNNIHIVFSFINTQNIMEPHFINDRLAIQ